MGEIVHKEISKEFLQQVLEENDSTKAQITYYSSKYALGKGENYLSLVFRVHLKLSDNSERHWIIKTMPSNQRMVQFLEESKMFLKEIEIYDIWLPKMLELYEKRRKTENRNEITPIWPRYYKSSKNLLILEDLAPLGFKMFPRRELFDLEHTLLGLRALAEFHIYSMLLLEEQPNMNEILKEAFFNEERTFEQYNIKFIRRFLEVLKTWKGFERFVPIVEKIVPKNFDLSLHTLKIGKHKALVHSDAWINNFLFKYNEQNKPCDIRLLDFQVTRICSPVIDIHFFINTSIRHEIFIENENLILNAYYEYVEKICLEIDMQIPFTFDELKEEYDKAWFWGFSNATTFLPIVLGDPLVEDSKSAEEDDMDYGFEKGERFGQECRKKLLYFEEKGYLNQVDSLIEQIENNNRK